jgi:hypothetical protein
MGELGPDLVSIQATDQAGAAYKLTLAPGDRVRLFDRLNARFLDGGRGNIGNNGSVLEVRAVNAEGIVLRTASGRDGAVSWESLADKKTGRTRLAPGDVLTIDAAQGITSSEHINAMPAGSAGVQGFKGYTAESRHRDSAWLITSDGAERREVMTRRALGDARPVGVADVWENVARNLARQPAKASALDFMERAHEIGRGTARAMQAGFRRWSGCGRRSMLAGRRCANWPTGFGEEPRPSCSMGRARNGGRPRARPGRCSTAHGITGRAARRQPSGSGHPARSNPGRRSQ